MSSARLRNDVGGFRAVRRMTPESENQGHQTPADPDDLRRGNALGGRGGPEDELLIDGQEEVFSRTEVELGRIEHHTDPQTPPQSEGAAKPR